MEAGETLGELREILVVLQNKIKDVEYLSSELASRLNKLKAAA